MESQQPGSTGDGLGSRIARVEFPAILNFLLWPSGDPRLREMCVPIPPGDTTSIPGRLKVVYGGRDGIKSWNFAQALLRLGSEQPLRILCARETQNSIQESVHQLLQEHVRAMGLGGFYTVLQYTIRGANGTEILFRGLSNLTSDDLKSFQSIDVVWLEEAAGITRRSWQVLIPTIRKPGSQIWVTFNPELSTDETYKRCVLAPPPGAVVLKTSYRDNLWLSPESKAEIEFLRRADPDAFEHVYEGATRSTVEGAIYKAEIMRAEAEGRICRVPYDPSLPVRTFWDLGWSDKTAIWFAQWSGAECHVIDFLEDSYHSTDHYLQVLQQRGYTYSAEPGRPAITWPWDASSKMARESMEQSIRAKGFTLRVLDQGSRMAGIDAVRRLFPMMRFDAERCDEGIKRLRRYQWGPAPKVITAGGVIEKTVRDPLHDDNSHAADALRTLAVAIRGGAPKREETPARPQYPVASYSPFG